MVEGAESCNKCIRDATALPRNFCEEGARCLQPSALARLLNVRFYVQALLRGDFGEEDTVVVSAPGGAKAEGLVLSHPGGKSGSRPGPALTDADLLGVGASADASLHASFDADY